MSKFKKIEIGTYFNHRLFYPEEQLKDADVGLDKIIIIDSNNKIRNHDIIDGIPFIFGYGKYDNLECGGQIIEINEHVKNLHIIGFYYWGDSEEIIRIIYNDGEQEGIGVPFINWGLKSKYDWRIECLGRELVKSSLPMMASGSYCGTVFFHHICIPLGKNKKVEKIVLPEDFMVHILAITIEIDD